MSGPRVLLIGWDAADWKVIQPLLDAGRMPNLARLIAGGVRGNIATIYPVLSPMLWTSIATGKRAYKHGIHGFAEPLPDGSGVRPITLLSRKTKAVWNILNQTGRRSIVVGWWPSHPAEPLNGVMVSNHFHPPPSDPSGKLPMPAGTVHPASLAASLDELRVNPMELSGEFLRLFVPEYDRVDQARDKRLHTLARIIAETMSVHAAATELLETQPWDFAAIYYSAMDHFGHGFMSYHPPRLPWVSEPDFDIYQHVIVNACCYHDAMLGELLRHTDENTTVILMSDHGFHPDHLRPAYIPAEPAGPAVEHRHFGILCLKGPSVRVNEQLFGASLLDLCPTILTLFGLPPGRDMDGKVLLTAFMTPPAIEPIPSWDDVPGDAGNHSAETRLDPVASALAFKQLVELGYVAPPGPNVQETVAECVRELRYNLARSYRDGNCCGEAAALAEDLWTRWPREHRFGLLLADCLSPLRQVSKRRAVVGELNRRIALYQAEATAELARRAERKAAAPEADDDPADAAKRRARFEERQWRELAHGRPLLMEWLFISQALLENRPDEARRLLAKMLDSDLSTGGIRHRVAAALAELGDFEAAQSLLEKSLEFDLENPIVHGQLADIHFKAGRFEQAIGSAAESLSLLYFQPGIHALLGQALMETGQFHRAEQALRVAVAQSPRNLAAHEALGRLYRRHLNRPDEAFAHEGRALSLRHELADRRRQEAAAVSTPEARKPRGDSAPREKDRSGNLEIPPPFDGEVDPGRIITIVSGLPRSGTSLMMQLLVAAGREALTDGRRAADEDNPLGYLEFEKTLSLPKDVSWLPQARGKAVKIVAQLLPYLPRDEHYNLILMERDLDEIVASQHAMLVRQGRPGVELEESQLAKTFAAQLERVRLQASRRPEMRMLAVHYAELLADPVAGAERLARFLGGPFDAAAAAKAVRPELRRQRS
jgi:predicted AlkP superfamily phosphohydrolase/phosphomutase/tetratricopeptide (TPR) repeat protein